ncbi:EAL domain-containing protein [Methylomonas sp. LL1]|uniref:EAL domain-containing protein n=1 Tax=Methylomonas sp. LL1 TaxID=2785785 RepID=UPI0018C43CB0|nr:EAL domain-containing protein [Methylomonas sp. LL1]QPK61534.1 EAL domain-containing protein [Methylomonas sp. LL1]
MRFPGYRWQALLAMLGLAGVYAMLAKIVLSQFSEIGNVTLVWFSGGLGLAILLIKGMHYWPGIFIGAFAAGLIVDDAFWMSFFIAAGNTLESVAAAWCLSRSVRFSITLNRPGHFIRLTMVAACCSLISAVFGPWAIWSGGLIPMSAMPLTVLHWWMADVFGIVSTTPVILIWRRWPKEWFQGRRWPEALLFIGFCLLIGQMVFLDAFRHWLENISRGYWLYLCMFWGALRFGRHGVMLVSAIVVVMGLFGAAHHVGLFARDFQQSGMLNFWFYTAILSCTGTVLVLTLHSNFHNARILQVSRHRLQAIIDASPIPYALNDDGRNITLLNPAFIKIFGYTLDDIPTLAAWWPKAYPDPEYRRWVIKTWQQRLQEARQANTPFQPFEVNIRCKNGETRTALVAAAALGETFANVHLVTLQDITVLKQSSLALAESNQLLQTILETLPIRVFWKDRQSRYLGANRIFAQDAGLDSVDALLGKNDYQLGWWEQASAYQADDKKVMETGQSRLNYEEPQTTPAGEQIWLRTSKLPLRNLEQQIIGVLGIYEDISLRKRIEDQLLWRTTFLETLLESSPDGILAVDSAGKKMLQNQRVCDLWGIPPEIAEDPDDNVQIEFVKNKLKNPEQFVQKVAALYANPELTIHDQIELLNGVILERYSSPVRDRLGHYYGRIWHFSDVTQMHRAQRALQQQEYYQRSLLDNFPFLVWLKDRECRYLAVNRAFAEKLKTSISDIIGKTDYDLFPADLAASYCDNDLAVVASRRQINVEEQLDESGRRIWVETYKAPLVDDGGQVLGTVGFARDITQRKETEEALKLAALVFENSSEAMVVTDADNKILNVNAAFIEMTGYSREDVLGKDPKILGSGEHDHAFYQAMWQSVNQTGRWHGEIINRRKNGELYVEELVINTIYDQEDRPQRRVALFFDITQRKQSEEQIWQQANFDPLTGLPNRRMLRERLQQEIKKAHRMRQRFGLLFIDLDRFKEVNDSLGHEIGDVLLVEAARRLVACVRESDTVARLGGDEFTIILCELDAIHNPERVAKDLMQRLNEPFCLGDERIYLSASIGITLYPDDSRDLSQLLRNADQAMYAAKSQGRNRYSFFTLTMQEATNARAAMLNNLREALQNGEFKLVYQPIVDMASGSVIKAEALLRWCHPVRGLVGPAEFVPLAEESGLIHEIGDWVFHAAIEQAARWRERLHPDFQISINKSPRQFQDSRYSPHDWIETMRQIGLPGHAVVVEITEGLLLEVSSKTTEHLLVFRDAGIQVAIDDFGTGYSSLSYLKKFDIDFLKIDQSFVRNLSADSSDFVLCEAIIVMAHKLGLKVIAEGVETELQRDLLASIGCDFGQGYWFAKPVSAEEFETRFAGHDGCHPVG